MFYILVNPLPCPGISVFKGSPGPPYPIPTGMGQRPGLGSLSSIHLSWMAPSLRQGSEGLLA